MSQQPPPYAPTNRDPHRPPPCNFDRNGVIPPVRHFQRQRPPQWLFRERERGGGERIYPISQQAQTRHGNHFDAVVFRVYTYDTYGAFHTGDSTDLIVLLPFGLGTVTP